MNATTRPRDGMDDFTRWAARRPQGRAVWQTTALIGGIGCSLLHAPTIGAALFVYFVAHGVALLVMLPWFAAQRNGRLS